MSISTDAAKWVRGSRPTMPRLDELPIAPSRAALPDVAAVLLVAVGAAIWTVWQAEGMWTVGGYIIVWAGTAVAAYGLAHGANAVVTSGGLAPRLFAATLLALNAVYHLTPVHRRLLGRCRSPFGLLVHYASYRGRLRDLRAGLHHELTCQPRPKGSHARSALPTRSLPYHRTPHVQQCLTDGVYHGERP